MRWLRFSLSISLLLVLCYFGDRYGQLTPRVPGPAAFFNPFSGFWQQAEAQPEPQTLTITHPQYTGEIIFDERAVPHIFAPDRDAAAFLLGYCHAYHRLWQMDISTRATGGRLAEVLGPGVRARDELQRRKGILQAAKTTAAGMQKHPPTAKLMEAYTEGVNTYIQQLSPAAYPLEFKLLGYAPEPWTTLKSAIFYKSMAESLCFRNFDQASSTTLALVGDSLFQALFPEHNPAQSPIIPTQTPWELPAIELSPAPAAEQLSWLSPYPTLPQPPAGIGSNNWALSGDKTSTGFPILANDPHLQLTLPSIWYEVQLHTPDASSYGVSLPSLPGILIGFNEQSAWGITNVGQDVLDWYRITWTDSTHTHYLLDGEATPVEWISDTIKVRDAAPVVIRTPWTVFGPVVYESTEEQAELGLAMRWVAHDPPFEPSHNSVEVFQDLIANHSLDEYRAAISGFDNPGSNIAYANHNGDIALTVTGRFPLRHPQQGRFVQDGRYQAAVWPGFIPFSQVPTTINPARGFVSSANQRSTDLSYPYYYLGTFDDYRGRYLNRKLAQLENATVADMQTLQFDSYSLQAEELVPLILTSLANTPLNTAEQAARQILQNWDYRYTAAARAPVVFQQVLDTLAELTFDELWQYRSEGRSLLKPETWRLIDLLANEPEHPLLDRLTTPVRENADSLLRQAFRRAVPAATAANWNEQRATRIPHLARIPGLGTDVLHTDGSRDTPNAVGSGFGPSWRMIVSLEDPVRAWGVIPGGASGNPGSSNYTAGIEAWTKGDYFELPLWNGPKDPLIEEHQRIELERLD